MTEIPEHGRPSMRLPDRLARIDISLPLLVLAVSLTVAAWSWRSEKRNAERVLQHDFDIHVQQSIDVIERRVADYRQVLQGAAALFAASDAVEPREFRAYVAALRLQPSHAGLQDLRFMRSMNSARSAPVDRRTTRMPVAFELPSDRDSTSNPGTAPNADAPDAPRHDAMTYALDHGPVVISRKVALPSGAPGDTQPGFMMYLPVYKNGPQPATLAPHASHRAGLLGWVAARIRIADLLAAPASGVPELDVEVYDGDQISGPALLFDTDNAATHDSAAPARYRTVKRLQVANNHVWTIAVRSLPRFEARLDRSSAVKAWFGAGISLLLALVTWLLAGSRARAVAAARNVHRELIERETRYRQMFEQSASIAFMLDPDSGRIVDANLAAEAFWGYPLRSLRRMRIFEIDVAPHGCMQALLRDAACGVVSRVERRHRLADGDLRDVELHAGKLVHEGKVLVYAILHDITTRKQAEHALRTSEERFRLITEHTCDVIWMMDAQTLHFTYISPSVERQRGYKPEEVMAMHCVAAASPQDHSPSCAAPELARRMHERIRLFTAGDESQRRDVMEIDRPRKDGRMIPIEVVSTLLCDENNVPRALIGISRDISARRLAQEEQKRFVAMVSHEFRTPLATIDGAVQRLQATVSDADAATHNRFTKIQKAVDRLTALLDDYLVQDRISAAASGLHLSRVSPLALLRDAEASARALSAGHVIEIDVRHAPASILCDADRLRLTLRVLADNAVKYTPPGSRVMLRACARDGGDDGVDITVSDNGYGIPKDDLPYVFDKFFRGSGPSQLSSPGLGLGLHLARCVVEMHGGTLHAANRADGGAQFTVWLPNACRSDKRDAQAGQASAAGELALAVH